MGISRKELYLILAIYICCKSCFFREKLGVLDQEIHWSQIPKTTCGTSFSLPSVEESHCVALILYENSFKSFDGTAEDSDNPL
jgi:hypothetical protein